MKSRALSGRRTSWSYPLYLANGVVGVRDMWGPSDANAWRIQHARYKKPSPAVYLASPIIDGPKPIWPESIAVANAAQGREAVDLYKARGSDFIKVYSLFAPSPVMGSPDDAPTHFQIHTLAAGPNGKLLLLAPERVEIAAAEARTVTS